MLTMPQIQLLFKTHRNPQRSFSLDFLTMQKNREIQGGRETWVKSELPGLTARSLGKSGTHYLRKVCNFFSFIL